MQGDIATIQYSADEILEKQFCLLVATQGGWPFLKDHMSPAIKTVMGKFQPDSLR